MTEIDRRTLFAATLGAGLALPFAAAAEPGGPAPGSPGPDESIRLWPKGAPGLLDPTLADKISERSTDAALSDRAVEHIRDPRLDVFRPLTPNGAAVMIMPGGGYQRIVIDREGYEMGAWLAARGFTAFVLFYRLPSEGWRDGPNVPLADAQRSMRLIRARAPRYAIDPPRVAAMGFSAGGHLCADLSARFDARAYDPIDAADRLSARPFIVAPIYPVVSMDRAIAHAGSRRLLIGDGADAATEALHSPDRQVSKATPPTFLCAAEDDATVPVENTIRLRAALKAAGVPVETHLFEVGGHGFGLRKAIGKPVGAWPDLFLAWARTHGLMG